MKFSIVTPVYNSEKYIHETIESILSQDGNFEIEYIIQDGVSTDGTLDIIRSYAERISTGQYPIHCKNITFRFFSEKDNSMYDAIEKGFARTSGEIMAYLNADDKYLPGALASVASIFSAYPDIEWVKGISKLCDEHGILLSEGSCYLYRQPWIKKGVYGRSAPFIQQESVFWKKSLWEKACPKISSFRLAGDFALWITFAKHTHLWSFNRHVSIFRRRTGQLSSSTNAYRREQKIIAPHAFFLRKRVLIFFSLVRFLKIQQMHVLARGLYFIFFPFHKKECYIDFDFDGNPIIKRTKFYLV